jgi:membrane protease YdiL (CAAX protease family)
MPPWTRRSLFLLLGLGWLAGRGLAADWLAASDERGVLPLPRLWTAGALVLSGAAWAFGSARQRGVMAAISALLVALMASDTLLRLDPLPWRQPGLEGLPERLLRNARLHVRPGLYGLLGTVAAVGTSLVAGVQLPSLTLGFGRPSHDTSFGGGPWRAVLLRLGAATVLLEVAFLAVRGAMWDPQGLAILVPIGAGMLLTAMWEEALFRGLLRPLAESALGARAGNLLQALLFSALHLAPAMVHSFSPELAAREAFRFLLWVVLGWFFGLAARETKGLAVPVALHFVLGFAIYVSLVFRPAAFLG